MPWIESHTDLENHPKLLILKSRLRWSKNETVGFLHRFWWTVLKYAPSGVISTLPLEVMSETLDMPESSLSKAIVTMKEIGLLDEFPGGELRIHEWLEYTGSYLRDSKYRRNPGKFKEIEEMYVSRLSADCQPTVHRLSAVPDLPNQPDPPNRVKGEALPTDGFARFWAAWPNHFRKKGKSKCFKHWKTHNLEVNADRIVESVESHKQCRQWLKDKGEFIPGPLPWLNDEAWEAVVEPAEDPDDPPLMTPEQEAKNLQFMKEMGLLTDD